MELLLWYVDIRGSFPRRLGCKVYTADSPVLRPLFLHSLHSRLGIGDWAGSGSQG